FSGAVFGGIHCLGWNGLFQGRAIWRVASLAIVSVPVSILLLVCYSAWLNGSNDTGDAVAGFAILVSSLIYIAARVTLIVLMLMSLRSLPPGVYDTV
ncbi:hypothetical protein EV702DRAFT_922685, partial [Suillus placidus]